MPVMHFIQFDFNSYAFTSLAQIIIGVAFLFYLLRVKDKTPAIRFICIGLAAFTLSVTGIFLGNLTFWGGISRALTETGAVFSMASMVSFCYHYPEKEETLEAKFIQGIALTITYISLLITINYVIKFLMQEPLQNSLPFFYWFFNPLTFLFTFLLFLRRAVFFQRKYSREKLSFWRTLLNMISKPASRQTRLFRNYSLVLSLGMVQGIVSILASAGYINNLQGGFLIKTSMLLMIIGIVYASFDLLPKQPGLIVRLMGLSLVTLLGIMATFGIFSEYTLTKWIVSDHETVLNTVMRVIQEENLQNLPPEVTYVLALKNSQDELPDLIYNTRANLENSGLLLETTLTPDYQTAIWGGFFEQLLLNETHNFPLKLRYGSHPYGSYHEFAAYRFTINDTTYETGFDLDEMQRPVQQQGLGMVWAMLLSSFFILVIFPLFFRSNLILPLERLLAGVRQADQGDLSISVPLTHNDEVGYLTQAFNKLISSLQSELERRNIAEAKLRELNSNLEKRVSSRTRELEVLYDVSAAASQTHELQTLLSTSLKRIMAAMNISSGVIFLSDNEAGASTYQINPRQIYMVTCQGIPTDWMPEMETMLLNQEIIEILLSQKETLLISDTSKESRLPKFLIQAEPATLILVPLLAEDHVLGIMGLFHTISPALGLDDIALLTSISRQVGVAIHTENLRQRAQKATVLEERQQLTRNLHDSVIQSLYGLVTLSEAGQIKAENGEEEYVKRLFTRIGKTARQAIREIRLFIHQLRPPVLEQEGLINALDLRLAAVEGRFDIQVNLNVEEELKLTAEIETAFYHIAEEALNNILKHAQAETININLHATDQNIVLEISDDGCGFDSQNLTNRGLGLANMQERINTIHGELLVRSEPGKGTLVRARTIHKESV